MQQERRELRARIDHLANQKARLERAALFARIADLRTASEDRLTERVDSEPVGGRQ
jgi:hypothetical protein